MSQPGTIDKSNGNGNLHNKHIFINSMEGSVVPADYVWLDGELVPFEKATVHFLSPTLHYGLGVFEGIRCYATAHGPAVFRLQEHLDRFIHSAQVLGIHDFEYEVETLWNAVCRLIQANNLNECYIRPLLYFTGPLGLNMDSYRPAVGIAAWKWDAFLGKEAWEHGVRLMVSPETRSHPNVSMAKTLAVRAGFDEAIMLDPEGFLSGCTGENLIVVKDNVLCATPKATVMSGVTQDTAITLARDLGYDVVEQRITRDLLHDADEAFVCGTAAEIVGVREVDYKAIGSGNVGPVTRRLQELFLATVHGNTNRSPEWLEYVIMEPLI